MESVLVGAVDFYFDFGVDERLVDVLVVILVASLLEVDGVALEADDLHLDIFYLPRRRRFLWTCERFGIHGDCEPTQL